MLRLGKTEKDFQELYGTYYGRVHRVLLGMVGNSQVAHELVQEAFLKAWRGLPLFGQRSSMKTWLYQVAINQGRDWLRSHKNKLSMEVTNEEQNGMNSQLQAIQEALLETDEDSRSILILHYYEEMKMNEIAEILKVPVGTVKSRMYGAKQKLKNILLAKGFDV